MNKSRFDSLQASATGFPSEIAKDSQSLRDVAMNPQGYGLRYLRASKCECLRCEYKRQVNFVDAYGNKQFIDYAPEICGLEADPRYPIMVVREWCKTWVSERIPEDCPHRMERAASEGASKQ